MLESLVRILFFLLELIVPEMFFDSDFFVPVVVITWLVSTMFYGKWAPNLKQNLKKLFGEKREGLATDLYIIIRLFYYYISFISISLVFVILVSGSF